MSSLSLVYLSGASLFLLLTAVSEAQYDDFTPAPDYDSDYNATFEYSFYSNASSEDLDRFSERFIDEDEREGEVTVTKATIQGPTEQGGVDQRDAASLPVSLDIWLLICTLVMLLILNTQQLQQL